jgi:hypothetical protein
MGPWTLNVGLKAVTEEKSAVTYAEVTGTVRL